MHAAKLGLCHFYELLKEEQDILNNNGQMVLMVCVLNRQLEFAKLVLHQAGQRVVKDKSKL